MIDKLILRVSNELGNQMFMYASAYSISKKLNRKLYLDNETAFLSRKNVSKYGLNFLNISSPIAPDELKFKYILGYLKRKYFIKFDSLRKKKFFYIEKKDKYKKTQFSEDFFNQNYDHNLFLEGHFESEKYFKKYKDDIKKEFTLKNNYKIENHPFYSKLNNKNSVSICLRQNRFIEGVGQNTAENKTKSINFVLEQINYINKSAQIIKSKLSNPAFYLWSNDFKNIDKSKFNFHYEEINLEENNDIIDRRTTSLFLMKHCNHFIVTGSTFNWWGAWLSDKENKIILRPSDNFFSDFYINNKDFWPLDWNIVNV